MSTGDPLVDVPVDRRALDLKWPLIAVAAVGLGFVAGVSYSPDEAPAALPPPHAVAVVAPAACLRALVLGETAVTAASVSGRLLAEMTPLVGKAYTAGATGSARTFTAELAAANDHIRRVNRLLAGVPAQFAAQTAACRAAS